MLTFMRNNPFSNTFQWKTTFCFLLQLYLSLKIVRFLGGDLHISFISSFAALCSRAEDYCVSCSYNFFCDN